jgi:hypothetical protein
MTRAVSVPYMEKRLFYNVKIETEAGSSSPSAATGGCFQGGRVNRASIV